MLADLRTQPALAGRRIEALTGRMSGEEKEAVMTAFADGRIDLLVATTVVEVGVDVANATFMMVLDADRFGVSQLHQLRGRVGRGGLPGLCLLVTHAEPETPGAASGWRRSPPRPTASRSRRRTSSCAARATCSARASPAAARS